MEVFKTGATPKAFYQGRTTLARGDKEPAQHYFAATIPALEKWVRDDSDDFERHGLIGLLYAYMDRNEDAIREARRAVELAPESQDAFHGAMMAANLAMVYALIGEQDAAFTLIERLLSTPGPFPGPGLIFRPTLRWPTCVCAGSGTRSAAIRASRKSSPARSRRLCIEFQEFHAADSILTQVRVIEGWVD